jgi:hypothetical protein
MADPLSITANIVAVLAFSLQSCSVLAETFRRLRDAPAQLRHATVWIQALQSTFSELHKLASDPRFLDFQAQIPDSFAARLADCRADLDKAELRVRRVSADLQKRGIKQSWARIQHGVLGEQWLHRFSDQLQMYQSVFTVDLITIQLQVALPSKLGHLLFPMTSLLFLLYFFPFILLL